MKTIKHTNENLGEVSYEGVNLVVFGGSAKRIHCVNCGEVTVVGVQGRDVGYNFVQVDKCQRGLIAWNDVINTPGRTSVEDIISIFRSQYVEVANNWLEGATRVKKYSGSGVMLDAGADKNYVHHNTVFNTVNVGIGVASGVGNLVASNRIFSQGGGTNGNVGLYVADQYPGEHEFGDHVVAGNKIAWLIRREGDGWVRNDAWLPDLEPALRRDAFAPLPASAVDREKERAAWLKRARAAGHYVPEAKAAKKRGGK